jgi:hypothetical protein
MVVGSAASVAAKIKIRHAVLAVVALILHAQVVAVAVAQV